MQESCSRVGRSRNLFKRRALDTKESRSRSGLFSRCSWESRYRSSSPRGSCCSHASATRLLDMTAWARLPDPPAKVYPSDPPIWLCHVLCAPSPPPANPVFHPFPSSFRPLFPCFKGCTNYTRQARG
eukprot:9503283-Pyramimonas_sp.AAC.1